MAKFDIDKKGYNPEQVDEFIKALTLKYEEKLSEQKDRVFSMRNEVRVLQERVDMYQTKDKQISKALVYAVEKADQIEASARKLYELELKRISILYAKWQEIVASIEEHYGTTNGVESVDALIEEFKEGLRSICEQNNKIASSSVKQDIKNNSDSYIKNLLNKMDYVINSKPKQENPAPAPKIRKAKSTSIDSVHEHETARIQSIGGRLQSLNVKAGSTKEKSVGNAERYLSDDVDVELNNYGKNFARNKANTLAPNDTGFDIQDALNPKEDLEEIMKAFDFFAHKK